MTPTSERPERLLHKSLQSSFTTAEDGIENWELVPVDAGSWRPGRRPPVEGEKLLNEPADALLRPSESLKNGGSRRPDADGILGGAGGDQLIEAGKVAVHGAQRNVGSLGNVGPGRAEDTFLSMEGDRGVYDPSASFCAGGCATRHPVRPGRHN